MKRLQIESGYSTVVALRPRTFGLFIKKDIDGALVGGASLKESSCN